MPVIIGIDPGKSGAVAIRHIHLDKVVCYAFNKMTEHDISNEIEAWKRHCKLAYLEKVHAMPKQGVTSTFTFGAHYGFCKGLLVAHKIPYKDVTPQRWQSTMGCRSGGDKNVTKRKAQQLFPEVKITHAVADALLIAEYGRMQVIDEQRLLKGL
jgi:crossover junction endodeoxyribonuclease RuvC